MFMSTDQKDPIVSFEMFRITMLIISHFASEIVADLVLSMAVFKADHPGSLFKDWGSASEICSTFNVELSDEDLITLGDILRDMKEEENQLAN